MTPMRFLDRVILVMLCLAYIGLFMIGSAAMAWVFTGMG